MQKKRNQRKKKNSNNGNINKMKVLSKYLDVPQKDLPLKIARSINISMIKSIIQKEVDNVKITKAGHFWDYF